MIGRAPAAPAAPAVLAPSNRLSQVEAKMEI